MKETLPGRGVPKQNPTRVPSCPYHQPGALLHTHSSSSSSAQPLWVQFVGAELRGVEMSTAVDAVLNCNKIRRTTNPQRTLKLSKCKTLSPVSEEPVLKFEHPCPSFYLRALKPHREPPKICSVSWEPLVTVVRGTVGFLTEYGRSDCIFSPTYTPGCFILST